MQAAQSAFPNDKKLALAVVEFLPVWTVGLEAAKRWKREFKQDPPAGIFAIAFLTSTTIFDQWCAAFPDFCASPAFQTDFHLALLSFSQSLVEDPLLARPWSRKRVRNICLHGPRKRKVR